MIKKIKITCSYSVAVELFWKSMLVRWYFIALKGVTTGPPVAVNNALQDDTCFGISVRINVISVVCKHNQSLMFISASTMDTFNNVSFCSYSPQIYARWLGWWRGHGPVCRAVGAGWGWHVEQHCISREQLLLQLLGQPTQKGPTKGTKQKIPTYV